MLSVIHTLSLESHFPWASRAYLTYNPIHVCKQYYTIEISVENSILPRMSLNIANIELNTTYVFNLTDTIEVICPNASTCMQ